MRPPIRLKSSLKKYSRDLDKAISPQETAARALARFSAINLDVCAGEKRVDTGRLGIPVFMSLCGADARAIMPTRKQMGKGSSEAQARASALMELAERFSFFSFRNFATPVNVGSWNEAAELFGPELIDINEIIRSVNDDVSPGDAKAALNLASWCFYPVTELKNERRVIAPLDWFWLLGEFNGSSAGNTQEESLLQGLSELVERHVCALADKSRATLPTINPDTFTDPVLINLVQAFKREGVRLILKDISMGAPLPAVAALAWDPATFPASSEIVFTAGVATSPQKAAIRAITEVAQLGGDFCSNSRYEASGLPKFSSLDECRWLLVGPKVAAGDLADISHPDIAEELRAAAKALAPINVYAVDITHPDLAIPAHYVFAPGLEFRERDRNQSVGMFVGRKLAEEEDPRKAFADLRELARIFPGAHYPPFYEGLLALRVNDPNAASEAFAKALDSQPDDESRALTSFYEGYALTRADKWREAEEPLRRAAALAPDSRDYASLLGVSLYKQGRHDEAEKRFCDALNADKGSAMDLANRGACRIALGKTREAGEDLRAALELDPSLDFARKLLRDIEPDDKE